MTRLLSFLSLAALTLAASIPAGADEILLKDGSRVIGEVESMTEGTLTVKTVFTKELKIDWADVVSLTTEKEIPFLVGNQRILGKAIRTPEGRMAIQTKELATPVPFTPEEIAAINPPIKPAMTFKGFLQAGATMNDGNTQSRSASASGEFVARSDRQRFTIRALYNYADDNQHEITARNARGQFKYDFFFTKRIYAFASALVENDKFQDLRLRTALSVGPGFQFIEKGDFEEKWLKELTLSGEAGLSYFDEDYGEAEDRNYIAARWMHNVNWPIIPDKVILFHNLEIYPSLEDSKDFYLLTEQGIRFSILKNLFASFQVNWRYVSNPPSADVERDDTTILISLGYNFDLTS